MGTRRLLQGPTSFDRMRSGLVWSTSDSGVPSSIWVGRILIAGEELTTGAEFHSSCYWEMMFVECLSRAACTMTGNVAE